jgi:hypothetical protein
MPRDCRTGRRSGSVRNAIVSGGHRDFFVRSLYGRVFLLPWFRSICGATPPKRVLCPVVPINALYHRLEGGLLLLASAHGLGVEAEREQ